MDAISFWLVIASLILFVGYILLIAYYKRGWEECPTITPDENFRPAKTVTVIIPARNEQSNIGACISSLQQQSYPSSLLEIIIVDDHSTDDTSGVVKSFGLPNLRLISLAEFVSTDLNSYKKKAIEIGIAQSSGEWIITTDADCTSDPNWISSMMAFQQDTSAELIAGPVKLLARQRFLEIFQALDFLTLQGITAAAVYRQLHIMCNGANLGYSRRAFQAVNGFENIDAIASGDDMLLMHKVQEKFPGKLFYLKSVSVVVTSLPARTWKNFWQQRIRWSSKADKYKDKNIFRILLLVYMFNLALFLLFVISIFNFDAIIVAFILLLCKTVIEFPFVNSVAKFFNEKRLMTYFVLMQPFHLVYVIVAGFLGKFGTYEWKGRKVK